MKSFIQGLAMNLSCKSDEQTNFKGFLCKMGGFTTTAYDALSIQSLDSER
jgi:hypothetical protein